MVLRFGKDAGASYFVCSWKIMYSCTLLKLDSWKSAGSVINVRVASSVDQHYLLHVLASYYDAVHSGNRRNIPVHAFRVDWDGPWLIASGKLSKTGTLLTTLTGSSAPAAKSKSAATALVETADDLQAALAAVEPLLALEDGDASADVHADEAVPTSADVGGAEAAMEEIISEEELNSQLNVAGGAAGPTIDAATIYESWHASCLESIVGLAFSEGACADYNANRELLGGGKLFNYISLLLSAGKVQFVHWVNKETHRGQVLDLDDKKCIKAPFLLLAFLYSCLVSSSKKNIYIYIYIYIYYGRRQRYKSSTSDPRRCHGAAKL